ncbi:PREDICTED: zinc finger CCCH domain-containing protein 62-like isoform X2 [Ipomoea nil]|uniref:zinc finger CCCH domain-containing protein 62-like isoform X1 n=1 Tax=Ipomoea nil TaxID=35883 RepID=UPI000901D152|nr:PREDICTED: zinc finger CCCH domain-containing protein 62-like isoform X1 [Ipomoea nil]XP_019193019.1 PREDICTED: zinc finger CCCH domain-containing protein 62-like isoform X2 [Ipomoea nil]
MAFIEKIHCVESYSDTYDSDDSQEDPTFGILEETKSKISSLSISSKKTESRRGVSDVIDESDGEEPDAIDVDGSDQKSYESVQNMILDGEIEKLKIDQCKVYLRKHGLRLTGNKATLIERIKEHIDVVNGGGEKKYPVSSFILNCKGDACTGDVVLFEQNVYEMFNIASRSASAPSCGTRVVAGRIVKESYGMAKQQHTFTIEVLWSKGEKPLPALHPLLIKGRNLYRLKTMRQRWEDEGQRQKMLSEKHARGSVARTNREARIAEKEMRMKPKLNRVKRAEWQKQAPVRRHMASMDLEKSGNEHHNEPPPSSHDRIHQRQPLSDANVMNQRRQPLSDANVNTSAPYNTQYASYNAPRRGGGGGGAFPGENINSNIPVHPTMYAGNRNHPSDQTRPNSLPNIVKQPCRYYAQGRCYYGHNCKWLH